MCRYRIGTKLSILRSDSAHLEDMKNGFSFAYFYFNDFGDWSEVMLKAGERVLSDENFQANESFTFH